MKILYLIPAPLSKGPKGIGELSRRRHLLQQRASVAFDWEVGETDEGPVTIESIADEERCIPGMLRAALSAERDGFSAVIVGCFADPGLQLARSLLRIPVVGPADASLHLACKLGKTYGIVTTSDEVLPLIHKVAKATGLGGRMAGICTLGNTVLQVADNRKTIIHQLVKAGELLISRNGANVVVIGCMSIAFLNLEAVLEERLKVPVVCPLAAAIRSTETLLRSGLKKSKRVCVATPNGTTSAVIS